MTRALKRLVSFGLIGLLLFAQLAIAAYACPGLTPADAQAQATAPAEPMPNCEQMAGSSDKAAPNLCAEHCHFGQQGNQSDASTVPVVTLVSLYTVAPAVPEAAPPMSATAVASVDVPAAVPIPHAILHCCIRD